MSEDIKEKEIAPSVDENNDDGKTAVTESEAFELNDSEVLKLPRKRTYIILSIIFGLIFVLGSTLFSLSAWYRKNYFLEFKELLYVITGPIDGTGGGTVSDIIGATVPYALLAATVYTAVTLILYKRKMLFKYLRPIGCIICSITLISSLFFTAYAFKLNTYFDTMRETTLIYEENYVDPNTVSISAAGETKNLIYLYVESLETAHSDRQSGGVMDINYIPYLTNICKSNLSFSNKANGDLGGFYSVTGSGWTVAALLSSTSGIPFAFSVGNNNMDKADTFAPGMTNLGDILEKKGYNQEFLCGSDAEFGGRQTLFTLHGNYKIYDLNDARRDDYLPSPLYHDGWWGFEDKYLFEIAKDEITKLAKEDKPFNFTLLTVDTHPSNGHICDLCEEEYPEQIANVLKCTDKQVNEFIEWCKAQDFYEDTVIIITGDHPRMDNAMLENTGADRSIYNCFINAAKIPAGEINGRVWTTLDMFPTTLSAMGFDIEGNRLGLGTDMFSGEPTLAEKLGIEALNLELGKFSEFFFNVIAYPPSTKKD